MTKIGKEYFDDLTRLYNRRYLLLKTPKQLEETQRKGKPISIVLIDIDHFKNVNDTYGHTRGDVVLKGFGSFIKTLLRQDDTVFRYGGDEFVCILPNANYEQAKRISQRFIEQCRSKKFAQIRLTLSIGIATCPRDSKDWSGLFDIADRNLYSAKRHGRDQVGIFEKEKKELNIPTGEIIGRGSEISRIKELINPIFRGCGGAVSISGEIGVGKTRLVHEMVKNSNFQDSTFLESNLSATTRSIPYYPFREIVRTVINKEGKETLTEIPRAYQIELIKILPELSDRTREVDEHVFMVDKFRLFDGVRKFLARQSSKKPLFILLDNIHWADNSSLELLHYLVRALKESPIFFFFVYRVEEAKDKSFQNILHLMAREGLYEKINLEPLEVADVARMLSLIIDASPPLKLTNYILKETGGNPFFIEELMKSLETNGALIRDKEECLFDKSKKVIIPYSVEGVVTRKMGMIVSKAHDLLEYAAVIGKEFDFSFLRDLTKMNEGHLFDLMDEILEARLLKESGGERYCFSVDIIREIIYQQINKIKLRRYHQIVGEKLLSFYKGRVEDVVEELANHFYISGDKKRAIEYSMIAGDRARAAYANRDAIRFYTWTIECLKDRAIRGRDLKEIECLKKRAGVLNLIGENEKAVVDLEEAVKKAKAMRNRKKEADCLKELCKIYQSITKYDEAMNRVGIALKIYRELHDRKGEAESLSNSANIYFYLGEYQKALEFYHHSLQTMKEIGHRPGQAMTLNNIGNVYFYLGEYQKALVFYRHSLQITEEVGNRFRQATSLNNVGNIYLYLSEYQKALVYYEHSLKIVRDIGDLQGEIRGLINTGIVHYYLGGYQEALGCYEDSLRIEKKIGNRWVEAICLTNIGAVYRVLGDYKQALDYCKYSLKLREEIGDQRGEAESLASIGDILVDMNNYTSAKKHYRKSYKVAYRIKSKEQQALSSIGLSEVYLEKNQWDEMKKWLNRASILTDELDSKEMKAKIFYLLGYFYTKEKKWRNAKNSFTKSISIFKEIKNRFELARVYYYQGLMFKGSRDETNTKKYFTKAMRIFKKIGAKAWKEKVEKAILLR